MTDLEKRRLGNCRKRKAELLEEIDSLTNELSQINDDIAVINSSQESKVSAKQKIVSIGRKKFNDDPKKGVEYLVKNDILEYSGDAVAEFLFKGEGLQKKAIGDFIGENDPFNVEVMEKFVALHNFKDLILVQALRQLLWSFVLPGESQKIDRIMDHFAKRYCNVNPGIFHHEDACYLLSYAVIMLNTSLHNPSVREKERTTLAQFIYQLRGIDNGHDIAPEFVGSLYESIREEPFKFPMDDGNDFMQTFFSPDREGWLWKQGGRYKTWKRRWFMLSNQCLYYFEHTPDKEPRGIIPLECVDAREVTDRTREFCFELYSTTNSLIKACKTDSEGKVMEGNHFVYRMAASSKEEQQEWIRIIKSSINKEPFYSLLALRKDKLSNK